MFKAILEDVNSSLDRNKENLIDRIKGELKKGANVNLQSEDGLTALHYAACHNCTRVIETLLEERADINIQVEELLCTMLLNVDIRVR